MATPFVTSLNPDLPVSDVLTPQLPRLWTSTSTPEEDSPLSPSSPSSSPVSSSTSSHHQAASSPEEPWVDSPRTLCKTSPLTEFGDSDLPLLPSSQSSDDMEENSQSSRPLLMSSRGGAPLGVTKHSVSRDAIIGAPFFPTTVAATTTTTPATTKNGEEAGDVVPSPSDIAAGVNGVRDHISAAAVSLFSPQQPTTIQQQDESAAEQKRPPAHLRQSEHPISPYSRPSQLSPAQSLPPVSPYLYGIPRELIRFYKLSMRTPHTSQVCISPKDLILPNVEYRHAYHPEEYIARFVNGCISVTAEDSSLYGGDDDDFGMYDEEEEVEEEEVPTQLEAPVLPIPQKPHSHHHHPSAASRLKIEITQPTTKPETRKTIPQESSPVTNSAIVTGPRNRQPSSKRNRSPSPDPSYMGSDEEYELDEDDAYAPTPTPRGRPRANHKRQRVSQSSPSSPLKPTASTAADRTASRRTTQVGAGRTTARANGTHRRAAASISSIKDQASPGEISRSYGCEHGCTAKFSTAYEARRHQEDGHGRPEAQTLMEAAQSHANGESVEIYPRDNRFLIKIGLVSTSAKWDEKTKEELKLASKAENESKPLSQSNAGALLSFAKMWVERYVCPRCRTSFSRLDSRKRHLEKQCK